MPPTDKPPAYRRRMIRGRAVAYLTLRDAKTKARRDFFLGDFATVASRTRYAGILAEWERRGRRLPDPHGPPPAELSRYTVAQLAADYVEANPVDHNTRQALRVLIETAGTEGADSFGPKRLRAVRDAMVEGNPHAEPPRPPWSRPTCNRRTRLIVAIWKWAVGEELLPPASFEALRTVRPLAKGKTKAHEPEPVGCVPAATVAATLAHMPTVVATMVRVQQVTGMRSSELCAMRPCDLDLAGEVWTYTPTTHKTAHHGHTRTVYVGPRAQALLRPLLKARATRAYIFDPRDAVAELRAARQAARRTPPDCGNAPGTNRAQNPRRAAGDRYTKDSYGRAVARACAAAFPPPPPLGKLPGESVRAWKTRLSPTERAELAAWRRAHRWHPHQLRHTYATEVRRLCGLEAAQLLLGHASAKVTDAVYADRDRAKAAQIAAQVG